MANVIIIILIIASVLCFSASSHKEVLNIFDGISDGGSNAQYATSVIKNQKEIQSALSTNSGEISKQNARSMSGIVKVLDFPTVPVYQMYTVAGTGIQGSAADGAAAASSMVKGPHGLFVSTMNSNLFVTDAGNNRVRKINLLTGSTYVFAGDGTDGTSGDGGAATSAQFTVPLGVAGTTSGVIYVADFDVHRILSIKQNGIISKFAGTGTVSASPTAANGDGGAASSATLNSPTFMCTDSSGNLYFADYNNHRARKVDFLSGKISTVVGTGTAGSIGDSGYATAAQLNGPHDVFVDSSSRIFVTEYYGNRIRVVSTTNSISLFAGLSSGAVTYANNIAATSSGINQAYGLWGDTVGNVFYFDSLNRYLRRVDASTGIVASIASNGATAASVFVSSGPALSISLLTPRAVRGDSQGLIFVSDVDATMGGSSVRGVYASTVSPTASPSITPTLLPTIAPTKIPTATPSYAPSLLSSAPSFLPSSAPTVSVYQMYTVAGNGVTGAALDNSLATSSSVSTPIGLFVDTDTYLYVAEYNTNKRVRKVNLQTGISNIFAGDGTTGSSSASGPATSAKFQALFGVVGVTAGAVYVSDNASHKVCVVSPAGIIANAIGTGTASATATALNGDGGAATSATVNKPCYLAVDASENIYFVDNGNSKVRKVDAITRVISTIAGTGTAAETSGDGGFATSATFNNLYDVFVDSARRIFLSEFNGNQIRLISTDNIVTLFAGLVSGATTYANNAAATSSGINDPFSVWADTLGDVYFTATGTGQNLVRVVSGFSGIVMTIASSGASSASLFVASGPALSIPIIAPRSVRGDSQGRLFVADYSANTGGSSVRGVYASTQQPTASPTQTPTSTPSIVPTIAPTSAQPTKTPTATPSNVPTSTPTIVPTVQPSVQPTRTPTTTPSSVPTTTPTTVPTQQPSAQPSKTPTATPSSAPSLQPTSSSPSSAPTVPVYQMYTLAGNGVAGSAADGAVAASSPIQEPHGIFVEASNTFLYFNEFAGQARVRKINLLTGITHIFAGDGTGGNTGDGGRATSAKFYVAFGVAGATSGVIYVSDKDDHRVRAVGPSGIITKYAGTGAASASPTAANEDGAQASTATIKSPFYVATDAANNVYIIDSGNSKVRKVNAVTTVISTIAGSGGTSFAGDGGYATSASLSSVTDVFVDSTGRIYISDSSAIRVVSSGNSIITSFAGGPIGDTTVVDNVPATATRMSYAHGVWADTAGNVFFTALERKFLRVVSRFSGIVTTIAGYDASPVTSFVASGPALSMKFADPRGMRGDSLGRIFVADTYAGTAGSSVRAVYASTQQPTTAPTVSPTTPTMIPSLLPTVQPTISAVPTISSAPSFLPSSAPTVPVYQMYTVAGNGVSGNATDGAVATSSSISNPYGLFVDAQNAYMYLSDNGNRRMRKIDLVAGIMIVFAGDGTSGTAGDGGAATNAQFIAAAGITGLTSGVIYVSDAAAHTVRAISSSGIITKLAGSGALSINPTDVNGDGGLASSATLNTPNLIAKDSHNHLYIADRYNHRVRKVDAITRIISTVGGTGTSSSTGDGGAASSATLAAPRDVFVDSSDRIYIAESAGNRIRAIDSNNIITLFAGLVSGDTTLLNNVPATSTGIYTAYALWGDTVGNIYYSATGAGHNYLRMVSGFSGIVTTIASNGASSASLFVASGPALSIPILGTGCVRGDSQGRLYITDYVGAIGGSSVRGVYTSTSSPTQTPTLSTAPTILSAPSFLPSNAPTVPVYQMYTVAGNGVAASAANGAVATSSSVSSPYGLFLDSSAINLHVADADNKRVRRVNLGTGITYVVAGDGTGGSGGDGGQATSAQFSYPIGVAGTTSGVIYVSDFTENIIRAISSTGIISRFVGTGTASATATALNGDGGAATSATLKIPIYMVVDADNIVLFADRENNKIRRVDAHTSIISTVAGNGIASSNGDGGSVSSATINGPLDIFIDSAGKMYISEYYGNRIRAISTNNIVTLFAGMASGLLTYADNVPATATGIDRPYGLWGDTAGNIYYMAIAPSHTYLRMVSKFSGVVNTIASNGATAASVFVASGPALSFPILWPRAVRGDSQGRLYVTDVSTATGGSAVRCIYSNTQQPTASPTNTPTIQPTSPPSMAPSTLPTTVPTESPTTSPSMSPSIAPSIVPSLLPSRVPTTSPSATPTSSPTTSPTVSPTGSPSASPSTLPSTVPSISPSEIPTIIPTNPPSPAPSTQPTIVPSPAPSVQPSVHPSTSPTSLPSIVPSTLPTNVPTVAPSAMPTVSPSQHPTILPGNPTPVPVTESPSKEPTIIPSPLPTVLPSAAPTPLPSLTPSSNPSAVPSVKPTVEPSMEPSAEPSVVPSVVPSIEPTILPSHQPTTAPSFKPTLAPSLSPTVEPSNDPTTLPTATPSTEPTTMPSSVPSLTPSVFPSALPSALPSVDPTCAPSIEPSRAPTYISTQSPTWSPTAEPTNDPSIEPSFSPSSSPSVLPSVELTASPSSVPIVELTTEPSCVPSVAPTEPPSVSPSITPSLQPSVGPSDAPSISPTTEPTTSPTLLPTATPTLQPTSVPAPLPSTEPSASLSIEPSIQSVEPSILPSYEPSSVMPSVAPSLLPTSQSPTQQPAPPPSRAPQTIKPTMQLNPFPTSAIISVILSLENQNRNISVGALIVLPFLRVNPSSNSLAQQGFYDIDLSSREKVGTNYVVYVNRSPNRPIDLNTLSPNEGFQMSHAVSYDYSGRSVSNAGDINDDGYDDLIIGVPFAARCYVLFGTVQGFVNMTEGFTIFGQADSMTGWSVSGAGDVNNDTFADIIIGAPYARDGSVNCGAAYVIYGKTLGHINIHLQTGLSPAQGFTIYGATQSELLGLSVSSAGDVNNDGFDDVIIGALKATSSYRGGAYVVYGTNASRDILQLNQLSSSEGFSMSGPIWSYSGYSVSAAGDVNGDGFDDVLIGSVPFRTTIGTQTTYLVYGSNKTITAAMSLSATVSTQQGVVISGGGVVVSGVGDINHDGCDDIMIGSNYAFNIAGFVTVTFKDTYHAPSMQPTASPSIQATTSPTETPSRKPTTSPSKSPTREPTQRPSRQPTVQQSGPSEPPTEAPTGPTSTPSSMPTISTELPTSCPTTSFPSSRPSTQPTSRPSAQPSKATDKPTFHPTTQPSESTKPTVAVLNPSFRSRNPVLEVPSQPPTTSNAVAFVISSGGTYHKQANSKNNFMIDTNETVLINGVGSLEGDIYTVLPQVNGSLYIEVFNNISDKLNLTSHSTIHSMSELVITSGSVIITFPTSGQKIRLANLTPLDTSENNFIFGPAYAPHFTTDPTQIVGIVIGAFFGSLVVLFVAFLAYSRGVTQAKRIKQYKEGKIALEDNPTRLIIAVNDMYAHFDAYTPNNQIGNSDTNQQHNGSSESLFRISGESKSNENSPLNSFETQNSANAWHKEHNHSSGSVFSSGGIIISNSTIHDEHSTYQHNIESGQYSYQSSDHHSSQSNSQCGSLNSRHSSQQQSDFNVSMDSDLLSGDEAANYTEHNYAGNSAAAEHSDHSDAISMDSDLLSMV